MMPALQKNTFFTLFNMAKACFSDLISYLYIQTMFE